MDHVSQIVLIRQIGHIKFRFREENIGQAEYQKEMALTKAALEAVHAPGDGNLLQLGDHIEGLVERLGTGYQRRAASATHDDV